MTDQDELRDDEALRDKIAGAVDEYLTPFIESIIRQAKEEAWDEGYGVGFLDAMLVRRPQPNPYREQEESDD